MSGYIKPLQRKPLSVTDYLDGADTVAPGRSEQLVRRDAAGLEVLGHAAADRFAVRQEVVEIILHQRASIGAFLSLERHRQRQRPSGLVLDPGVKIGQRRGASGRIPVGDGRAVQPQVQALRMRSPAHGLPALPGRWWRHLPCRRLRPRGTGRTLACEAGCGRPRIGCLLRDGGIRGWLAGWREQQFGPQQPQHRVQALDAGRGGIGFDLRIALLCDAQLLRQRLLRQAGLFAEANENRPQLLQGSDSQWRVLECVSTA